MIRAFSAALGIWFVLIGCAQAQPLRSDPSRMAAWTKALRDAQPDGPYALVYRDGDFHLIFVAAQHENAVHSPTFQLINQAFTLWPVRSVIVEGSPSALGADPPDLMAIATRSRPRPDFDPDGETGPAVRNAVKVGARIYGGEADDRSVRDLARRAGISAIDLVGFYVLRVIPQWSREGLITRPDDPRLAQLVDKQLRRSEAELGVPEDIMPDYDSFSAWYRRTNGKPLSAGVNDEESGPLVDGRWPTNRIGAAVSQARNAHLLAQIADRLNKDGSILVVFGASHAMIDRPALDAMLGCPCYAGADMRIAAASCSSTAKR